MRHLPKSIHVPPWLFVAFVGSMLLVAPLLAPSARAESVFEGSYKDWKVSLRKSAPQERDAVISTRGREGSTLGFKLLSDGTLVGFIQANDRTCAPTIVDVTIDDESRWLAVFKCVSNELTLAHVDGGDGSGDPYFAFIEEMEGGLHLRVSGGGGKTQSFSLMGFGRALHAMNRWWQSGSTPES